MSNNLNHNSHHYAIDAAKLVEKCRRLLHSILDVMESKSSTRAFQRRSYQLASLSDALKCIDRLIHAHLLDLLDREMEFLSSINESDVQKKAQMNQFFGEHEEFPSLMDTVKTLKLAGAVAREYRGDDVEGTNINSRFDGIGEELGGSSSVHRSAYSTPPTLSIDDPIEEENSSGMWYAGRRSPSPPAPPGESALSLPIISSPLMDGRRCLTPARQGSPSPPPPINRIDDLQSYSPPPPPTESPYSSPNHSPLQARHRKSLSTGYMEIPRPPISQTKRSRSNSFNPSRSAKDSSLFRLIVTLQLCLVRIEEANSVLCDGQARAADRISNDVIGRSRSDSFQTKPSSMSDLRYCRSSSSEYETQLLSTLPSRYNQTKSPSWKTHQLVAMTIGVGGVVLLSRRSSDRDGQIQVLKTTGKVAAAMTTASFIRKRWRIICMKERVANSADALEDWIFNWICLVNNNKGPADGAGSKLLTHRKMKSFWYSNSSIRIQLIKRGMDLLYASIGKAIEITRGKESNETSTVEMKSSGLWTYVVASVAASYYNVIGPGAKSAQVLSSSSTSIIQGAWGMVSLNAVKTASLEATRILKGAAIAGRIEICGVSCFVLSREPFPALASALRRFHRQQEREDARLGTIHEKLSSNPSSANVRGFQSRNVIFHLTGGGFFAHTIAGEMPFLLDWSAATNAVVVIPEYALLPHHKFPDAIEEVERIYRSLRFGHAVSLLGFQPDKIIVTGESVGGNLASALCVSLIMSYEKTDHCEELSHLASMELVSDRDDETDEEGESLALLAEGSAQDSRHVGIGLPDALMLCCPALNLSSDMTQSRIDGAHDPVLPSGLLAVISSSYVKNDCDSKNPLASPYFATDVTLRQFPSTLIFTGSEDPLLDDSVTFNARLRGLGVKSYLRAVHDMPHAFWALSTAGIGLEVQSECQEWLQKAFCIK